MCFCNKQTIFLVRRKAFNWINPAPECEINQTHIPGNAQTSLTKASQSLGLGWLSVDPQGGCSTPQGITSVLCKSFKLLIRIIILVSYQLLCIPNFATVTASILHLLNSNLSFKVISPLSVQYLVKYGEMKAISNWLFGVGLITTYLSLDR